MARQIVFTPKAATPPPAYSQAVKAAGLVFVSGTAPIDPATGTIIGTTIQEQTRQCLTNIRAILEEAGSSLDQIVSVTVVMADEGDFAGMNEEWLNWFPSNPPARQGAKLPVRIPGLKVSIAAIAEASNSSHHVDDSRTRQQIDALIARFFSSFDNRNGASPQLADVSRCFTEKAVIARRSRAGTDLHSLADFATPRIALLCGGTLLDFHELETSSTTQVFDGIAVRTSRYRKSGVLDGNDYAGSGTKCFQLVEVDGGWRIASLAWVDDDAYTLIHG